MSQPISHIHIAYGSESGNTEALAKQLHQLDWLQTHQPSLCTLNELDFSCLQADDLLLILTSSFGDGEPPANADEFANSLENLTAFPCRYALFGLGDTSYDQFCGFSQQIEALLNQKQAKALIARVDADLNYQAIFKQWLLLLQQVLQTPENETLAHDLSVKVYNEKTVYEAEVLEIKHLAQSEPAVYHLRLSLQNSGIFYQAGDLVYVQVSQPDEALALYENWFDQSAEGLRNKELRLLSKNVLRDLNKILDNAELKNLLKISNKKALETYLYGRDLLDVLRDFDAEKRISLQDLAECLPNLTARAYSISSCGKTHPEYVDLCVRHVHYHLNERSYQGTTSDQLAHLKEGQRLPIFIKSNATFHLPENLNAPVVMIGSGAGIAPHIGFLDYLAQQPNKVESYLFFGERHQDKDFLYEEQLNAYQTQGVLTTLFTAFSRDQEAKFYVQDAMCEQGELLWKLIQQGAYFYICGSKSMSKAVDEVLLEIADKIGEQPFVDDFNNIIATLIAEGRLMRDVY